MADGCCSMDTAHDDRRFHHKTHEITNEQEIENVCLVDLPEMRKKIALF